MRTVEAGRPIAIGLSTKVGTAGDAARVLERPKMVDQLLRPADGEGRHDERAAPVDRRPDDPLGESDRGGRRRRAAGRRRSTRRRQLVRLADRLRVERIGAA